jgi:hypothetical protein
MVPHHLILPTPPPKRATPYFGMLELERNKGAKEVLI